MRLALVTRLRLAVAIMRSSSTRLRRTEPAPSRIPVGDNNYLGHSIPWGLMLMMSGRNGVFEDLYMIRFTGT